MANEDKTINNPTVKIPTHNNPTRNDPTNGQEMLRASSRAVLYRSFLTGLAVCLLSSFALVSCRFGAQREELGNELRQLETSPWVEPNSVVARVNGREITRGEFYLRVLRRFGTSKLLAGLVKEELFLQEAERLGLKIEPSELNAKVDEVLDDLAQKAGGHQKLEARYRGEGLSVAEVRRDLEREVATQLLIGKVTRSHRNITDEVVMNYYKRTRRYKRFIARQIAYSFSDDVSKLAAYDKAMRAANHVRGGADFSDLAKAESEDPVTGPQGGWLGAVHEDTPMKPTLAHFKTKIMSLAPNEVSDPVENPDGGYHIFQVTEIRESQSFAACQDELAFELRKMDPDVREIEALLRKLQENADVEVLNKPFDDRNAPAASRSGD